MATGPHVLSCDVWSGFIAFLDIHPKRIEGSEGEELSELARLAAHQELLELLDNEKIERETESFSTDPKPALTNLKHNDIRIILGNFDEEMARRVFCAAIEQKMVGGKYLWIIPGDYSSQWWRRPDPSISCTADQLRLALQGFIGTVILPLSSSSEQTIAKMTARDYELMYNKRRTTAYSQFHGYAYDGIWVIARALDSIIQQNGGGYSLSDFQSDRMQSALNETNFVGVTGRVSFNNGDRVGEMMFTQFQGTSMRKIGEYNAHSNSIDLTKGDPIIWPGKGPPRDRTLQEHQLQRVNTTLYVVMCILASLGIIVAIFFLAINIRFRTHRYIKMSSPNMNNIIIIGCVVAYISLFLLGTDGRLPPHRVSVMCTARSWVLSIAFTLSFGAMFSKTWRVHVIFTNIKLNKKVIKDYKLFILVAVLLLVDVLILGAWQVFDPLQRQTKQFQPASFLVFLGSLQWLALCQPLQAM